MITSFARLPLILGLAERLQLSKELNAVQRLKQGNYSYSVLNHLLSLTSTLLESYKMEAPKTFKGIFGYDLC